MKALIVTTGFVIAAVSNSFAQGQISFRTIGTVNPVYYGSDDNENNWLLIPTSGNTGSFGAVNYEIYSAPTTAASPSIAGGFPVFSGAWSATVVGPVAYAAPGVVSPSITITLPAASGAPGAPVQIEIVAYTGSLESPTLYAWSGENYFGNTITVNGLTTSVGALGWTQPTGNPNNSPPNALPATLVTGSAGFGSLYLVPLPEPSTIILGGLGVAALLFFRRRG